MIDRNHESAMNNAQLLKGIVRKKQETRQHGSKLHDAKKEEMKGGQNLYVISKNTRRKFWNHLLLLCQGCYNTQGICELPKNCIDWRRVLCCYPVHNEQQRQHTPRS